jgi:hypothetical protein
VGSFIPKKMGLFVSAKNKEGTGAKPKKMKQACIKDPRYEINNPKEACFIFFNGNEQSPYTKTGHSLSSQRRGISLAESRIFKTRLDRECLIFWNPPRLFMM